MAEGRRPVEGKVRSDACSGRSAGLSMSQKQRVCGSWRSNPRSRLTFGESPLRESRTVGLWGRCRVTGTSTRHPYRPLSCSVSYPRGTMTARFGRCLGALAPQVLHAGSDHRKIVSSAGAGALAAHLLHARSDRRKIVSGARAGHVSSVSWSQGSGGIIQHDAPSISEATELQPLDTIC